MMLETKISRSQENNNGLIVVLMYYRDLEDARGRSEIGIAGGA
jgi:hypothetical protein